MPEPSGAVNEYVHLCRVKRPADVPPPDKSFMDVAVLDMHHGWPNMGHDSLVRIVAEIACDIQPLLDAAGFRVRVISYDVRACLMIPESADGRFGLYLGTGGPGHLDPRQNDGAAEWAQGIRENPEWEAPLYRLYDSILRDPHAALIAICHSFGILARWAGIARPVLRGPERGGKSSGVKENVLTREGMNHPWFRRFSAGLSDGRHFRIMDSRLFDLIPGRLPETVIPLSREGCLPEGSEDDALTGFELARDPGGIMPRVYAVNHHPEIRDRRRQLLLLSEKLRKGEVTAQWYEERARLLKEVILSPQMEWSVLRTSQYMLIAPLRFHLYRLARRRAVELGCESDLTEDQVLLSPSSTLDRAEEAYF